MKPTFRPTWLYIKQHNQTGLKYFGKTIRFDPYKYRGSGTVWTRHLKKHGNDVTTIWAKLFHDRSELIAYALKFSEEYDISKSSEWANLIFENGEEGSTGQKAWNKGIPRTADEKAKMSRNRLGMRAWNKGIPRTADEKAKMSQSHIGLPAWNRGIHRTEEEKIKMKEGWAKKDKTTWIPHNKGSKVIKIECPYCKKFIGGKGLFNRWHGEKCKLKK